MTGETHKAGGMLASVVGFAYLKHKGILLQDVSMVMQWLVIYPFCMWGSLASDLDHHEDAIPLHDYPSVAINRILHLTKKQYKYFDKNLSAKQKRKSISYKLSGILYARHRSWQTHSDMTLFALMFLMHSIVSGRIPQFGAVDIAISSLILIGIIMGVVAHFILDILTPDGVYCAGWTLLRAILLKIFPNMRLRKRFSVVPSLEYFATGGVWELKVRKWLGRLTKLAILYFVVVLVYPYIKDVIPFEMTFEYGG